MSVAPADPWGSELQQALYRLWLGKRDRGRAMPAWSAIDPIELRQWLGDLHLLEVIDGGRDFRYRVHGTRIGRQHGNEMPGTLVSEWPQEIPARAYNPYRRID